MAGLFKVVAWREGTVGFHELKRAGADRIRATQRQWLWAALRSGVAVDNFRVVEWSLTR